MRHPVRVQLQGDVLRVGIAHQKIESVFTTERLKFIRAAQATGFSLKDIGEMLALTYSDEPPCEQVAVLIQNRLADVKERLKELKRLDRTLSLALKSCCKGGPDWCNEIARIKTGKSALCAPPRRSTRKPLTLH